MTAFTRAIHFGSITAFAANPADLFDRVAAFAVAAEQAGFDALLVPDHLQQGSIGGGPDKPLFEAWTLLGALAARTSSIALGALVSPVTTRHPSVLAKAATSLDVISGGRAIFGYGAGWDAEEHVAFGIDFPSTAERMDRLDEGLEVVTRILGRAGPTFSGRFYSLREPHNVPAPLGSIPIVVAGGGERRTLRAAATYGDACNVAGDLEQLTRKFAVLDEHCRAVGRDPAEVQRTVALPPLGPAAPELRSAVLDAVGAGATGVVALVPPELSDLAELGRMLADLLP
jgi:F420-dependent oxidoreductase-like protein